MVETPAARSSIRHRLPSQQRAEAEAAATAPPVRRRRASAGDATRRVARRITEPVRRLLFRP